MKFFNMKSLYYDGLKCYEQARYVEARNNFNITLNDAKLRVKSIIMIARIDISEGKYFDAREKINNCLPLNNPDVIILKSLVDLLEYNYDRSESLILEAIERNHYKHSSLLKLATVKIQNNKLDEAKEILLMIRDKDEYKLKSDFSLILIDILNENYSIASKRLNLINKNKLNEKYLKLYYRANLIVNYKLGKEPKSFCNNVMTNYIRDILTHDGDLALINHINLHKNKIGERRMFFYENLDIQKLLYDSREIIKTMNPNYYNFASNYRVRFNQPIGYFSGREINGVCISTLINTDKILTIYPIELSNDFDIENKSKVKKSH